MNGIPGQDAASLLSYVSGREGIRILFVEDDEDYREALGADLSGRGFVVHSFADAASLLDSFDSAVEADVIILDWKLPRTSGIDLLRQLRRRGVNLPVVFLTGLASTVRETLAFDRGAIDFIDKTRGVDVLVSRLKRIQAMATSAVASSIPTAFPIVCAIRHRIGLLSRVRAQIAVG